MAKKIRLTVTPETATFSKAAAADVVITVSGNASVTITGLKNASATVNADNYSITGSALTIKAAYLAGLANGDKTFHVIAAADGADQDLVVNVTVGD